MAAPLGGLEVADAERADLGAPRRRLNRGRHLRGFFACLYFAGLRPTEALGLRKQD